MHAATGKLIDTVPAGKGCGSVVFDDEKRGFYSNRGARTIVMNKNNNAFLPTVDFETNAYTARPIPETFRVLIVSC